MDYKEVNTAHMWQTTYFVGFLYDTCEELTVAQELPEVMFFFWQILSAEQLKLVASEACNRRF